MTHLIFDIETNGLYKEASVIHCIVTKDIETKEVNSYHGSTLVQGIRTLNEAETLIGHNIIDFDCKVLEKLYPNEFKIDINKIFDTLLLSWMFYPERNKHGLESWGEYFGVPKPVHEDWSTFSKEMLHRCKEDVNINHNLYKLLKEEYNSYDWKLPYDIEKHFRLIMSEQEHYGWKFDNKTAVKLCWRLRGLKRSTEKFLQKKIKYVIRKGMPFNKVLKKDGKVKASVESWYNELDLRMFRLQDIQGDFSRINYSKFNPASIQQCVSVLLHRGWKPDEYNYRKDKSGRIIFEENTRRPIRTSPKLTYSSLRGRIIGERIVKYKLHCHRFSQIWGWVKRRNVKESTINAGGQSCGTPTARVKHYNVVNVPKSGEFLGREMRSLFTCREGTQLVGVDLKALENRILGHLTFVLDNGAYSRVLNNGDPHQLTADLVGCSRNDAKTINYAMAYGCTANKIASILNISLPQAKQKWEMWWEGRPAVKSLLEHIHKSLNKRGNLKGKKLIGKAYVKSIDKRKVYVRSYHSVLNALIQSSGSIIHKMATIKTYYGCKKEGIDFHYVGNFHDETQAEVKIKDVERYIEISLKSIEDTGKYFKTLVPMEGDANVGTNWSLTH